MAQIESHIAPLDIEKSRLSDYAVGIFTIITTRKGIKKAIKNGWISIDGDVGHSGDYIIGGECIELRIREDTRPTLEIPLEVIYEDEYLAILDKPAGITVSGNKAHTIENALPFNIKVSSQADALEYPQAAHRLDHPTSGVLIIGKTRKAVQALNELFEHKAIQKTYFAVCIGNLPHQGVIASPIDHKSSETIYERIDQKISSKYEYLNLVRLIPKTGRRHQLRKHLAEIGCPILGDKEYGMEGKISHGQGLYLHAQQIRFIHPLLPIQKKIVATSPLPEKFKRLFESL